MPSFRVDVLNSILIIVAFLIALFVPFQLFFYAYLILGPLHYLTQMLWLKEKRFYTQGNRDGWILGTFAVIATLASLGVVFQGILSGGMVLFVAFWTALACMYTRDLLVRLLAFIAVCVLAFIFRTSSPLMLLFGFLLPTLVHVFLFTVLFMLYGARKSNSVVGYGNVLLLVVLGASFFVIEKWFGGVEYSVVSQGYVWFRTALTDLLGVYAGESVRLLTTLFTSAYGVPLIQFVAFAYTYHYLNWFSKTKVIAWHKSARAYAVTIVVLWLSAIAAYFMSFTFGILLVYGLSIAHVVCEFPLNHKTIGALLRRST